ncbi:MAG TPA: GAF domain-containing protein [Ignavibacteria bacterium]|nr:GAF domain-containing protein [Ignavibacteria bacterium]
MAESILINKRLSLEGQYKLFIKQIKSLLNKNDNYLSNLSNLTAAFKQSFDKISWVGFYIFDGKKLYLGPFQGKAACTEIDIGKGACGTAAQKRETVIVPNVNEFPDHISCDADSRSEIVIPLIKNKEPFGVLDIDSTFYSSFNEIDKFYLEEIANFLMQEIL